MLRLGVALERYWRVRSLRQEASGLLVPALERPDARADPALFAAALIAVSAAPVSPTWPQHGTLLSRPSRLARGLGDDRLIIRALASLCAVCVFAGEPRRDFRSGRSRSSAAACSATTSCWPSACSYLLTVGPARSGQLLADAIACTERSGDHLINSYLHNNAGADALSTGDISLARPHLEAAAQAARTIALEDTTLTVNLGLCCARRGISTAPGPRLRQACGSAGGTGITGASPTPASAWHAWPVIWATGPGRRAARRRAGVY